MDNRYDRFEAGVALLALLLLLFATMPLPNAAPVADRHVQAFAGQDIRTLITLQARCRADHPYLVWRPFNAPREEWTYARFAQVVQQVAAGLQARGVKAGDHVLVHLDNCPETVFAWFGCAWLGAIAVTTNARASQDEIAYFASHAQVVGGITQPKFAARVNAACPSLPWLVVTASDNGEDAGVAAPEANDSFAALLGDPATLAGRAYNPGAPFSVQYTSGTTSRPKGVSWTHANALWGARINALHEGLGPDDIHLVTLPLFHTNAQAYSMLACLWAGATAVVQPRFSARRFWPVSVEERCTWTSLVPFITRALTQHPVPETHHYRLWGSAVCEPPTDAMFGVRTMGWWGMTETITHGIVSVHDMPAESLSIGRPAPEYEIRVTDAQGRLCQPGDTGELAIRGVRGLSLFAGYLHNEQATADSFDEDGYFLTGDRIRLGDGGELYFGDRSKDMLKVGGENVAASEIERVIMMVAGVEEVAVVARRHEMLDEVPVAFVRTLIVDPVARQALLGTIREACASALADFKQPHHIRLIEDFPRSTLEKIAKAQLRAMLDDEASA